MPRQQRINLAVPAMLAVMVCHHGLGAVRGAVSHPEPALEQAGHPHHVRSDMHTTGPRRVAGRDHTNDVTAYFADSLTTIYRDDQPTAVDMSLNGYVALAQNEYEATQLVIRAATDARVTVSVALNSHTYNGVGTHRNDDAGSHGGGISGLSIRVNPIGYVHRGPCPYATPPGITCPHDHPLWCRNLTANGTSGCGGHWYDKSVMGFAKGECQGCSTFGPAITVGHQEWYPYVVLDPPSDSPQQVSFEVAPGKAQPVLITVHADNNTVPTKYSLDVQISVDDTAHGEPPTTAPLHMPLTVQVYNFTLPQTPSRLSLFGVTETSGVSVFGNTWDTTAFHDFLLDHRIPVNALYAGASGFPSVDTSELSRLWSRGQRVWEPSNHFGGKGGELGYPTAHLDQFVSQLNASVAQAAQSGWPVHNMLLYAFDEASVASMPGLEQLSRAVKAVIPDIQIATCGNSQWLYYGGDGKAAMGDGTGNGTVPLPPGDERLKYVDIIIPRAWQYSTNWSNPLYQTPGRGRAFIEAARQRGKKIGWYVSGTPVGEAGLNWMTEMPAMRARLMTGVAAVKQESDAILYYRLNDWGTYVGTQGIQNVSSTLDVLDFRYCDADCSNDGEALLMLPNPSSTLSTMQFENMRDGLEDVEYYAVLSSLIDEANGRGIDVHEEAQALSVPDAVFEYVQWSPAPSNFTYTQSPLVFRSQRDRVATAIVSIRHKLQHH
eukprot:m.216526 g.216526  ORF g.216526 m.216526 type:complete len:717 (+) comp28403_c0_seq1:25-2175(+)